MKRKLALLLAAVMTLSMLPMNVFAATSNSVTRSTTVVPEKSLLYEDGVSSPGEFARNTTVTNTDKYYNDDIHYKLDGGYLVMTVSDEIASGEIFRLTLENAKWFFRNTTGGQTDYKATSYAALGTAVANDQATKDFGSASIAGMTTTFDTTKGIYNQNGGGADSKTGTYYRFADFSNDDYKEIPYELTVASVSDKQAIVKISNTYEADGTTVKQSSYKGNKYVIRIPLVSLTTDTDVDIRVKVTEENSRVSGGTYRYGIAGAALTKTYVDDLKTGRDSIRIPKLIIKESRLGSIKPGAFYITAPSGFTLDYSAALVGLESGLSWGDGTVGTRTHGNGYTIGHKDSDDAIVEVNITSLNQSSTNAGAIYIEELMLYPDDDSSFWGDINLTIKNTSSSNKVVTAETFKGGTRTDWTVSLTTTGTIPELVNGRYKEYNQAQATDEAHQTAHVVFVENSVASWWADRTTIFQLPQGVKFRKVDITKTKEFMDTDGNGMDIEGVYVGNDTKYTKTKSGSIRINGNQMTLTNFKVKAKEKARIEMDIWVSIESGYQGDVTLTVTGSAIPEQTGGGTVPEIVIAKQISPVTISSKITDIKIGYQLQPTADIVITETKAGNLLKNKTVKVSVTDFSNADVSFSPDTKIAVTAGDLKIKNIGISNNTTATGDALSTTGGTLKFDIDTVSGKASTITVSNVSVKIDRTVPESNDRPYNVVVWGSAIAENYDGTSNAPKDTFATPGIKADYLRVISSANDKSSLLSQRVEVAIGESTYVVNGVTKEMDAAAYISPASNSTLVPVRFIAQAFGIEENQVMWSDTDKTVTIIHQERIVQFAGNSDQMKLNGVAVTNYSPDGLKVVAEITGDRMYVPFRALGDAFGVKVDWDNATQTAIYNPDVKVVAE